MATASSWTPTDWTVADLLDRFGPIAHGRIRQDPPPGTATEQNVLDLHDREDRLYELVDGVLVEKVMGVQESFLTVVLIRILDEFVHQHKLGFILGSDGMARLAPGLVRIPDVSFISWQQLPERRIPKQPMLDFAPLLAIEVLSLSNTAKEMDRKRQDYFNAGVRLVWYVDPAQRHARVFTAVDQETVVNEDGNLTGEPILPGFVLPLRELFARLED